MNTRAGPWNERASHLVPAVSCLFLGFLYGYPVAAGQPFFTWAAPEDLFLAFKIEMLSLMGIGAVFILTPLAWRDWRGGVLLCGYAVLLFYAAWKMGGWPGVMLLGWLAGMQAIAAYSYRAYIGFFGLAHLGGYVYVVLLVRIFTDARGFDELTPQNILVPATLYFATRGALELAQSIWLPKLPKTGFPLRSSR